LYRLVNKIDWGFFEKEFGPLHVEKVVEFVLSVAKHRGFISCQLEVSRRNQAAYNMYLSQGFHIVEDRGEMHLLEIAL